MKLKEKFISLVWLFAALTLALSLGIPGGYNIGATFIILSSLGLFFLKPKWKILDREDRLLFWAFFVFAISMCFSVYLDGMSTRELDRPSRFIFALPVIVLLLCSSNRKEWLWYAVSFGAVFAFGVALYQRLVLGVYRADGEINAIMFGNTAMLLGFLSFAGAIYFHSQKRLSYVIFMLLGGLCGLGASVLSGTRGGWVGLPFISLFMFWQCRDLIGRKALVIVSSLAIVFVVTLVSVPQTGIQQRVSEAVSNIVTYVDGTAPETSVGARIDMWKSAIYMFEQSPIFGVGLSQVVSIKTQLALAGKISNVSAQFSHAHNEYLDALSKRGLFGFLFLLMIFLLPLRLFLKKLKLYKSNWQVRPYAIAGALIPMCYMDFGLTQVMFSHNIGVVMYAFPIVYFWAALRWAEREELAKSTAS